MELNRLNTQREVNLSNLTNYCSNTEIPPVADLGNDPYLNPKNPKVVEDVRVVLSRADVVKSTLLSSMVKRTESTTD